MLWNNSSFLWKIMAGFWELILVFNEITNLWWAENFRFEKKRMWSWWGLDYFSWDTVSSFYNHIPNIINLSKKAKSYYPDKNTLKKYQLVDLKGKGQTSRKFQIWKKECEAGED
jgi:hypothetical protein